MARGRSEHLFVQDDEFDDDDDLRSRRSTIPPRETIEIVDATEDDDDIQVIPAAQAPTTQPQPPPAQPPPEAVVDLTGDEPEQYLLTRFNQRIDKDKVYERLQAAYSKLFKRQAGLAMPDSNLKQRLEDIAAAVTTRPIGYVIDRDQKAWLQKLREQKRALSVELQTLVTFQEETLDRPQYKRAFRKALLKEAQSKVDRIEKDLKLREKLVEEMKIFAKMD
ncbi:hypothetical protein PRZ48_013910 [Zasmidium cellare]|uniref:Uncharacterized protein n=1 Tax=Zasmidium cellare TaxID=395010 RepID=A0ABR0DZH0_ZASCE|nr:hypothetical protein PRZ48_013910 [Zasmidium cellare]